MCAPARPVPWSGGTGGPGGQEITGCCAVGSAPALGAGGPGFESLHSDQLRNSHHRSVSGFAENCTLVGISSLSTATRFAGLAAEGERGNLREPQGLIGCISFVNEKQSKHPVAAMVTGCSLCFFPDCRLAPGSAQAQARPLPLPHSSTGMQQERFRRNEVSQTNDCGKGKSEKPDELFLRF